jgi:hypothetical protein
MNEADLEIIVRPGNWQLAGAPARWSWQIRQKNPPKLLAKGVVFGTEQRARVSAEATKAKILAKALG